MAILYRKKSKTKKEIAKITAGTEQPSRPCSSCGEEAKAIEVYPNYSTYRCTKCKTLATFSATTEQNNNAKVKKMGAIILRDRSGEKEKKEKTYSEETPLTEEQPDSLPIIQEGIKNKKLLSFKYVDQNGNVSKRTVEPYKVTKRGRDIILFAYCIDNKGIRSFKLEKIVNIEVLPYNFEPKFPVEEENP